MHQNLHQITRSPVNGLPFPPAKNAVGDHLGTKRQFLSGPADGIGYIKAKSPNKIRRYAGADQRQAALIYNAKSDEILENGGTNIGLAGRGVTMCGWTQIVGQESALKRVKTNDGSYRSFISGAQMCGLRWVCPICTAKRAHDDKDFVNDGLSASRKKKGVFAVMLTLTTSHKKSEKAKDILGGIMLAEQRIKHSKHWKLLKKRTVGYARVLEWTYGKNGHHPHFHTILLVQADSEDAAIKYVKPLKTPYLYQLTRAGRDGNSAAAHKHAFQVQGAAAAQNYITKWGNAEELTGAQRKTGGGLTPWQILRLSRNHEDPKERAKFARIWWDIIQATKGKSQLYKSAGFKKLVEDYRADHEPEAEAEPETVLDFGVRDRGGDSTYLWKIARGMTLILRENAELPVDLQTARAKALVLLDIGPTDNEIFDAMLPDDVDVIEEIHDPPPDDLGLIVRSEAREA